MKKRIGILLLTGLVMTGICGATAFAEGESEIPNVTESTDVENVTVPFTKNLKIAEGVTVPNVTFLFEIEPQEGAPEASMNEVVYKNTDAAGDPTAENVYVISKDSTITFEPFTKAGVYEYVVNEKRESMEGVSYDTDTYTLRVYVINSENGGFEIEAITAEKDDVKQSEIVFNNQYVENGSLSIGKNTAGSQADKSKDFTFKIKFLKSGTEDAAVTEYVGKIGTEEVTCSIDTETEFQLHDGEELVFDALPVGTRYLVTEVEEEDKYTPAIQVIENGTEVYTATGVDGTNLSSSKEGTSSTLVGENENKVVFTNTYEDMPRTGLFLQRAPFVIMILAAICAVVGLTAINIKKRG